MVCTHFDNQPYCTHGISQYLQYSHAHSISLHSHIHRIGYSYSHLHKQFLHLRGSDIHAKIKVRVSLLDLLLDLCLYHFPVVQYSFSSCGFLLQALPQRFYEAIGTVCFSFSSFMAFLYVVQSCLHACCHGVLQEGKCCNISLVLLCHVTLSRVESRHIRVFRLFTFPAFISKTRQYTQVFIVP